MERVGQTIAAQGMGELFRAGTAAGMSDAELLGRFATRRDEAAELAFGALVMRHGPMVLRVCRGVLRDPHDAEDAFQATFLVLVRRAGSLWVRDSLGPWLHQTAYRTACFARTAEARRRRHESRAAADRTAENVDADLDDFGGVIHEEIARLPDRYRAAVVLCLLEGRTPEQAAGHLGCPVGTVHSRLARGRERLRSRLTDRGVAVPAALLAATSAMTVSPALAEAVVRAAMGRSAHLGAAGGIASTMIDATTRPATRALPANALKLAAAVLSAGLVVVAIPQIGASTAGRPQEPPPRESKSKSRDAVSPPDDRPRAVEPAKAVAPDDDSRDFVAYAPDGETLATASMGGTVCVWDVATRERRLTFTHWRESVLGLAFSPGGDVLVGVDNQGMANLWDAKNGESKGELDVLSDGMRQIVPSGSGSAIAFSADGKRMAVGGGSTYLNFGTPVYQIRVFEANPLLLIGADPLRLTWEHVGRGDRITSLAFSPNGKTLAQSGDRGTLRLWDVETGDLKHILRPDRAGASVVAFSSDGKLLAAGGGSILAVHADKRVTIWDAATGERLRTLEGPEDGIRALAFAPNSHEIACGGHGLDHGGSGGKATLWDADSGVLRWTWKGSDAGVQSLAFAPDGKTLAVCDGERVHLIDAASGEPKRRIAKSTRDRKSR